MNEQNWRKERDSRSLRYAGRVLNSNQWILLRIDPDYAERYDGQIATLTAANLLGRMSPSVALDIPSTPIVAPLPWVNSTLSEVALNLLRSSDPYGAFCHRSQEKEDYIVHLGRSGASNIAHGSGWNVYCGPSPSPLLDDKTVNPIGPALAAILATGEAFLSNLCAPFRRILFNALNWQSFAVGPCKTPQLLLHNTLGKLWIVGTGSVGTAILYFLSLATNRFSTSLFDMDTVKIHNLDRSPLFMHNDVGIHKVEVTKRFLNQAGIEAVANPYALHESELWHNRQQGSPDIIVSTANERNVRTVIENGLPPVQIYGTTGSNWQAAVIRHIPLRDPCSLCLFPENNHTPTLCATDSIELNKKDGAEQVDAALPFLSFAAGAMAAAEILKLYLPDFPYNSNRVILNLNTCPFPRIVPASLSFRKDCLCQRRNEIVHRKMVAGSHFANLMPES